jgi:hypothetical protein
MGIRGPKPKGNVKIEWSPNFAYALGLLAADGCVSNDGRHITFVSKDIEQIENFKICLGLRNNIGLNYSGNRRSKTYRIQFGDKNFHNFLITIGITPTKSKTIVKVEIHEKYFLDFIRGYFDGDGYSISYWDKRWKSSFMFYIVFCSGSFEFLEWIQLELYRKLSIKGHIVSYRKRNSCHELRFSKTEATKLALYMYNKREMYLSRKYLKISQSLSILQEPQLV